MLPLNIILNILSFSNLQTLNDFIKSFNSFRNIIYESKLIHFDENLLFKSCERNYSEFLRYFVQNNYKIENSYLDIILISDYIESFIEIKNLLNDNQHDLIFIFCLEKQKQKILNYMIENKMYPKQINISKYWFDKDLFEKIIMNTDIKFLRVHNYLLNEINKKCKLQVFKKIVIEERIDIKTLCNYFCYEGQYECEKRIDLCLYLFENYKEYIPNKLISFKILKICLKEKMQKLLHIYIKKTDILEYFHDIYHESITINNNVSRELLKYLSIIKKKLDISEVSILYNRNLLKQDRKELIEVIIENFEIDYTSLTKEIYKLFLQYSKHDNITEYFLDNIPKDIKLKCITRIM